MKKKRSSQPLSEPVIALRKKKRICVKSFQQQQQSFSSTQPEFCLPDDCWERVFSFLINPVDETEDKNKLYFKSSLSLVSKQFLSITNRLIFSLRIYYPQLCILPRFFHRFSNLHSLDLWFASSHDLDNNAAIALALRDRPTLKSLSIFGIELKDTNYVSSRYIDSFMSLKGLNSLKFRYSKISDDLLYSIAKGGLPLKRLVLDVCRGYSYHGIYGLLSKCHEIQHLSLQDVDFLNNHHVSQLSLLVPDLISINLSGCSKLTESALFAIIKNCHSLDKITIERIYVKRKRVQNFDILKDFQVNPQLKSLHLAENSFINDEIVLLFASIFPNLQLFDLSNCDRISDKGICQVLNKCCKIRYLSLIGCKKVRQLKINVVVDQLKMLNLCGTNIDDKTLYEISKSCYGLLQLLLIYCKYVTVKGVTRVIENCTQLEEIDLRCCDKVNDDDVVSMRSSRPSLKIDYCSTFLF
ncbi:SCF E3 ubiquitin ligase complex F-box protein grrA-like [Vicia villosa]|uniref:SCF E3 ubiquitin ligase complex F-box protein grrA-like n=1 Tax=Vicia villosa TaxID=3911 RepID=UPI00273AEB9C|nr:SCF E3 ubiquitin ligase complex F-box protein grrA-like [Vicia villosa]